MKHLNKKKRKKKPKQVNKQSTEFDREGILQELPLTITSVSPQKKRKDRFSIFNNSRFLIGVSAQTLTDFNLSSGVQLTSDLFQKISEAEEYQAAKERCYLLLSGRDHSSFELKQKIIKKGFEAEIAEKVTDEFSEKGLLNDRSFAVKFACDKAELNKWGPGKIRSALFEKGIDRQIVEEVIQNLSQSLEQSQICVDLALKRRKHFLREAEPQKRKQKIYRYLFGKGYDPEQINKALPQILESLNAKKSYS